ncbi:MAG: hypothetical protein ABI373_02710 [Flavobacteriales bacterium]
MPLTPFNAELSLALGQHLAKNASQCDRNNTVVRVDRINAKHNVAYCSVKQRHSGLFRRSVSVNALTWRAQVALAPLIELGITPLITVQHKSLRNLSIPPARNASPVLRGMWERLGAPFSREDVSPDPLVADPFGWQQAMRISGDGE